MNDDKDKQYILKHKKHNNYFPGGGRQGWSLHAAVTPTRAYTWGPELSGGQELLNVTN